MRLNRRTGLPALVGGGPANGPALDTCLLLHYFVCSSLTRSYPGKGTDYNITKNHSGRQSLYGKGATADDEYDPTNIETITPLAKRSTNVEMNGSNKPLNDEETQHSTFQTTKSFKDDPNDPRNNKSGNVPSDEFKCGVFLNWFAKERKIQLNNKKDEEESEEYEDEDEYDRFKDDAQQSRFPWMVRIEIKYPNSGMQGTCGGAILSRLVIISACHCVHEPFEHVDRKEDQPLIPLSVKNFYLYLGDPDQKEYYQGRTVYGYFCYGSPRYARELLDHDISVIILNKKDQLEVGGARYMPICLPHHDWNTSFDNISHGVCNVMCSGYGREDGQEESDEKVLGWYEFDLSKAKFLCGTNFCRKRNLRNQPGVAHGDSGGAMISWDARLENTIDAVEFRYEVVGIISHLGRNKEGDEISLNYEFYTRIAGLPNIVQWLQDQLGLEKAVNPPLPPLSAYNNITDFDGYLGFIPRPDNPSTEDLESIVKDGEILFE